MKVVLQARAEISTAIEHFERRPTSCVASSHSQTLPPNAPRQLQGGFLTPSTIFAGCQWYQARLAFVFDERLSLNQVC